MAPCARMAQADGTDLGRSRCRCALTVKFQEQPMLYWALMFLLIALVATLFGVSGIALTATGIAQILFVVAFVLFVLRLVVNFTPRTL